MGACVEIICGSIFGSLALFTLLPLAALLGHKARKQARRAKHEREERKEERTVVVQNNGPVAGQPGVAEVVTSGPTGTYTTTAATRPSGTAVVSTEAAGIPGHSAAVAPGQTAVVKSEQIVGHPETAHVTEVTHS